MSKDSKHSECLCNPACPHCGEKLNDLISFHMGHKTWGWDEWEDES